MRLGLRLALLVIALLCLVQIVSVSAQESGYTYIVQPGDSWPLVAQRVGLTVTQLQEANPDAVRPNGWLIVGESLFVPWTPDGEEEYYIVQRGEGWISVAGKFGVPVDLLQSANPKLVRPNETLLVGERLLIPVFLATPTPVPTLVPTAAPVETQEEVQDDAPAESPSPLVTPTPVLDLLSILSTDDEPEPFFMPRISLPLPRRVTLPSCPEAQDGLGQTLTALFGIPTSNRHAQLTSFLADCGVEFRTLVNADLTSDSVDDAVLVFTNAEGRRSGAATGQGSGTATNSQELVILDGGEGHSLSYEITATGTIDLLETQDINADGLTDVVWTDTVCGSGSCFVTVHIRSWDGVAWRDWTKGTITMAGATVSLAPSDKPGRPYEIRLVGGQYAGTDAGPQRARLAVWTSTDGAPYALSSERMMPSLCLYHTVVDANYAMTSELYLEKAQWLYADAAENSTLQACGDRANELAELRSFALFRLALIAGYESNPELAAARVKRLASTFERQIYAEVGVRWLAAYQQSGDAGTACEAVYNFAVANPEVVNILADYGYANPAFTAKDVCPYLEFKQDEVPELPEPRRTETDGLPVCPEGAAEYLAILPDVINELTGGQSSVGESDGERQESEILKLRILLDAWLQACDAMGDGRGGLLVYDLNQDGLKDVIAMPSAVSDDGYGPGGAEGVVLILHQRDDGRFETVYSPEIEGLPRILAIGDANGDGRAELIWQLERCTTFCLLTVEAITWDSEAAAYLSVIGPGAAIAEGEVLVDIVEDESSDLPRIRRLWFSGGVSGREEKGLDIPHTEIWYSMDGTPVRRHTWSYDRANDASNCLGLRLIEANVALQSAGPEGNRASYATAIEMYKDTLESPDLEPCSVQGTAREEETTLLRGLANFRLVQVLTLNNQRSEAESLLETLEEEQPENRYTEAARAWLAAYTSVPNPVAACAAVMSIFLDSPQLWQITEEFGRDHPSLSMRQVCYVPNSGEEFEFQLTPNW
ncbi:MAG: LysM peptidoglycan-binding domain-containing protein [Caldilineaceae bacterium SB0670_bin_27]|uniref:LysM peptidoglycan-binding domain-containing protein n=1 Tax=Caldilineaceae bacterium SB0664_bin_27 TaxID=2605260 RepID=A0A6B0YU47_9CHLR|nr:LysM peptidoglycan-binding domain-containing protein [Caldilineaceae bacterium SB0664_bin_27]MYJ79466.1 LysM peptidoglycan-binding domain-containing protein [Caldilineaceae bacterium SB0670_bin_27]